MDFSFLNNLSFWGPLFAFAFAVVFIKMFQIPIGNLLSRVTAINKSGINAPVAPNVQRDKKREETVHELLSIAGNSVIITEHVNNIKDDLKQRGLNFDDADDVNKILIKHLATAQILVQFERIYGAIFGSQIVVMRKMNEQFNRGLPADIVKKHVEIVNSSGGSAFKIEAYMGFLISHNLVSIENDTYYITNRGVEFITWLTREGKIESKTF